MEKLKLNFKLSSLVVGSIFVASGIGATYLIRDTTSLENTSENIEIISNKIIHTAEESILLNKTPLLHIIPKIQTKPSFITSKEIVISSGDSFFSLLASFNVPNYEIIELVSKLKKHDKNLVKLKVNNIIRFNIKNEKLYSFDLFEDNLNFYKIFLRNKDNKEVFIYKDEIPTRIEFKAVKGTIKNSLYADGLKAGLTDNLIVQLANVFAWDIDFSRDISVDDEFSLVFEEIKSGDSLLGIGNLVGAIFKTRKKTHYAFRYEKDGKIGFFNEDGKNLKKAFIRSPVKFPRVTSKFQLKRLHPVLKINRPHKGVDYGGGLNTPIMSTGSGTIIHRGRKGGFGNAVIVDHGQGYKTLYAHMNKFKKSQKVGTFVKQGEVIGYMGKTGVATGTHLHYELTINGKHKDVLKLKLPDGKPVHDIKKYTEFKNKIIKLMGVRSESKK